MASMWRVMPRAGRCLVWGATCCLVLSLAGCGDSGPERYNLSGKVTYGGKPVPKGSVTFIPDSTKGNTGLAASVDIVDGQYNTSLKDQGHVGGPHIVKITGLDGKSSDEFPNGMPMFPDFELKADLPKEESTKDLEVPSDWVNPKASRTVKPTA